MTKSAPDTDVGIDWSGLGNSAWRKATSKGDREYNDLREA
jgi:hypothetical protein